RISLTPLPSCTGCASNRMKCSSGCSAPGCSTIRIILATAACSTVACSPTRSSRERTRTIRVLRRCARRRACRYRGRCRKVARRRRPQRRGRADSVHHLFQRMMDPIALTRCECLPGAGSGSLTFAFRMQHVNPAWSLDGSRGARADVGKTVGQLAPRSFKLVVFLQVHPALRIGAEVARQAQGCVGGNAAPFAHDLIYARGRDADGIGKRCAGQAEWHHEFLAEDFARMDRREFCGHVNSSMVVNDLYIAGVAVLPAKAHAKLVVDADAVLAGTVALEQLQPIARRDAQEVQRCRRVQLGELAPCHGFDVHEPSHAVAVEQGFRVLVRESFYHEMIVYRYTIFCNAFMVYQRGMGSMGPAQMAWCRCRCW